ncbi:hypothetical protein ANN_21890 [Periplaneta americana]|uniref:Uncharacterized protein n=1 Tax=Periplaneta americana TaxID=6978 RepID=A0ABQ8S6M2_PERAM|nr:hypothetical protein ANN_21890 [Periplaneta americana]
MTSSKATVNVNDPGFEDWANHIVHNDESDHSGDEGDTVALDFQNDHDNETEQEISDTENGSGEKTSVGESRSPQLKKSKKDLKFYQGKSKFKWSEESPKENVRTRKHNIITHLPGIIGPAKQLGTYCSHRSSWELLFNEELFEEVIVRTNKNLAQVRQKLSDQNRYV